MSFKFFAAAAALAVAAPVLAQPATHTELSVPAGKTPVKIYRQIARDTCRVGHHHRQVGKLPIMAAPAADADCVTQVAGRTDKASGKLGE